MSIKSGIVQELAKQATTFKYECLTKSVLEDVMNTMTLKARTSSQYVMFTNWIGMVMYDLSFRGLTINIPKHTLEIVKKGKYSYVIHFFKKHSPVKAYVKGSMFEIKKGTKLLFMTSDLNDSVIKRINEINEESFSKSIK